MISTCRGRSCCMSSKLHFSNASGKTVWLVYATVLTNFQMHDSITRLDSMKLYRINKWHTHFTCFPLSKYLWVISHASFQLMPFTSINILISSGMQSVGWVSFICTATFSGNSFHVTFSPDLFSKRVIISRREAEHNVYCCFSLRVFPSNESSPGYKI